MSTTVPVPEVFIPEPAMYAAAVIGMIGMMFGLLLVGIDDELTRTLRSGILVCAGSAVVAVAGVLGVWFL